MKYIILCRKCEYYKNKRKNIFCIIKYIYYLNKKNRLGRISNLDIQTGKFGKNFTIYHKNIIINPNTIIGDNCKLHGNNCIGNDGKSEKSPIIGNNVDIGVGAIIIGDITIGDNIIIGANSLVNKSFKEEGITIAGVPARRIK